MMLLGPYQAPMVGPYNIRALFGAYVEPYSDPILLLRLLAGVIHGKGRRMERKRKYASIWPQHLTR